MFARCTILKHVCGELFETPAGDVLVSWLRHEHSQTARRLFSLAGLTRAALVRAGVASRRAHQPFGRARGKMVDGLPDRAPGRDRHLRLARYPVLGGHGDGRAALRDFEARAVPRGPEALYQPQA